MIVSALCHCLHLVTFFGVLLLELLRAPLMIIVKVIIFDLACYIINLLYLFYYVLSMMCSPSFVYDILALVCNMPLVVYLMPLVVYQMPFVVIVIYVICYIANLYIKSEAYITVKCLCGHDICFCGIYKGGYKLCPVVYDDVKDYIIEEHQSKFGLEYSEFVYMGHMHRSNTLEYKGPQYIYVFIPLYAHVALVRLAECYKIAKEHNIAAGSNTTLAMMKHLFTEHNCAKCMSYITVFEVVPSKSEHKKIQRTKAKHSLSSEKKQINREKTHERVRAHHLQQNLTHHIQTHIIQHCQQTAIQACHLCQRTSHSVQKNTVDSQNQHDAQHHQQNTSGGLIQRAEDKCNTVGAEDLALIFPPVPLDRVLSHGAITAACKKFDPKNFEEAGCAVCGQLVPLSSLTRLSAVKNYLHILEAPGTTRQERHKKTDKIHSYPYVIDHSCRHICNPSHASIRRSSVPKMALAKGLWLGPVPEVLSSLQFIEKKLVARIRHSICSIRVASGMRKMKAHAIAYQQPIPKVYDILPPPKAEIEEVIAIMFTGPCKPTVNDFKHTPFLVRCNHIKRALEWLILNHADCEDITFSSDNLSEYPEDMPPVSIEYKPMTHDKTPESTSVHDLEAEDGTEEGDCAFTVHGLTGQQLEIMTTNAVKIKALQHLNSRGKFLAISHGEQPESIWHNPQLYPQCFLGYSHMVLEEWDQYREYQIKFTKSGF